MRRKHQAAKVGAALKYSNEYIDYNANPLNLLIVPYTIHQWINSRHYSNRVTPNVLCYCCETIIWYGVPSQNSLLAPFFRTHSLSFFRSLYFLITSNCTCDSQAQAQSTTTLFSCSTNEALSLSPPNNNSTQNGLIQCFALLKLLCRIAFDAVAVSPLCYHERTCTYEPLVHFSFRYALTFRYSHT